ncbi:MAG: ABC transporter substrate-binding protein [Gammaproteobacteria bacterium]|nr:ABC transporter substrate-binding protein [Gammaproteobacteria bacterium]
MRILIVILLSTIIFGCETTTVKPEVTSAPDQQAIDLFQAGDFQAAGREYLNLSNNYPESSSKFMLRAAHSFIKAQDYESASMAMAKISPPDESNQFKILMAKIKLENGDPANALKTTENLNRETISPDLINLYYESRASAYERLGENFNAAKELIILDNSLMDSGLNTEYTKKIWRYLITENLEILNTPDDSSVENLIAWIELTRITKSLITRKNEFSETLNIWTQLNPSHPANTGLISELQSISENMDSRPGQIALLLPLTGIYERYSEKIRDGFLTAWFNEQNYRPVVKIYNTDNKDIIDVYNQAVTEGANFIVGPLDKNAVGKLSAMSSIPVRTLALNQIEISIPSQKPDELVPLHNLVQFGLPPEDEARQVAQRGIFEGFNRALVVTSNDEFGTRVFNAFRDEWTEMGGKVLEKVEYNPRTSDFVTPIKQLLNIDSSEQRFQSLRQKLSRNILFNNRLREDAEFIFVVATNLTARQIVPHLRFFRAEGIPIYTTSAVFTGNTNPQIDNDLNGVEFVDIPWLLNGEMDQDHLATQIKHNWGTDSSVFPRYYAFGVDAFRLVSRIGDLMLKTNNKYQGETGELYMSEDGKLRRNLNWARFENGMPVPLTTGTMP